MLPGKCTMIFALPAGHTSGAAATAGPYVPLDISANEWGTER